MLQDLICEAHGLVAFLATQNPVLLAQLVRAKAVDPVVLEEEPPTSLWATALVRS